MLKGLGHSLVLPLFPLLLCTGDLGSSQDDEVMITGDILGKHFVIQRSMNPPFEGYKSSLRH